MKSNFLALFLNQVVVTSVLISASESAPQRSNLQQLKPTQPTTSNNKNIEQSPVKSQSLAELRTNLKPLYTQIVDLANRTSATDPVILYTTARVHAVMGNMDEAEKSVALLRAIKLSSQYPIWDNEELYLSGLADIGATGWKTGAMDDARRLLDKAVEEASNLPGRNSGFVSVRRRNLLLRLARPMVKFGAVEQAKATLRLAGKAATEAAADIEKKANDPEAHKGESETARRLRLALPASEASTSFSLGIVELQLKIGDKEGARTTLEGLTPPQEPEADSKSYKLHGYMRYWAQRGACGDLVDAKQALAKALKATSAIEDSNDRAETILQIAQAIIQVGGLGSAKETLAQASKAIVESGASQGALNNLVFMAELQHQSGDKPSARRTLSAASRLATSMGVVGQIKMAAIAETYAEIGDAASAKTLSDSISNDLRIGILAEAAKAYANNGNIQAAGASLSEAARSAGKMEHLPTRANTLISIAVAQSEIGDETSATSTLNSAETEARAIKDSNKDDLYSRLAQAQVGISDWARTNAVLQNIKSAEIRLHTMNVGLLRATGFGDEKK